MQLLLVIAVTVSLGGIFNTLWLRSEFVHWLLSRALILLWALVVLSVSGIGQSFPESPAFLQSKVNRGLIVADMTVRVNDAISSYADDHKGGCCHEDNTPPGQAIASNRAGILAYSVGVSVLLDVTAWQLWKHGGKLGRGIARSLLAYDIVNDGRCGIHNWMIHH